MTSSTSPLPPPLRPSKLTSALPGEDISRPGMGVPDDVLRTPRIVRDAVYSYVHPEDQSKGAHLLSWNKAMASTLGSPQPDRRQWTADDEALVLKLLTGATKDRLLIDALFPSATTMNADDVVKDHQKEEDNDGSNPSSPMRLHPWALCYGGHQFGFYAGQLGDGRAISLYETIAPSTGTSWELQLKGAGKTPYSRFADGYAVLRSSIREYLGAEASTETMVLREEGPEPGAIVCRLAPSWIRFGSFEIFHYRRDHKNLRRLAEYVAKDIYGFEDDFEKKTTNPLTTPSSSSPTTTTTATGDEKKKHEDKEEAPQKPFVYNRFARMFDEVARRTARMVSGWQAIGFCHGVINTDNMSILGLTIDYGPFAFLDRYDPAWICNHSDDQGRYMYQSQPGICLWNLTKLALTLETLIGAEDRVDDLDWLTEQLKPPQAPSGSTVSSDETPSSPKTPTADEKLKARGSDIIVEILQRGFRQEFLRDYRQRMNDKMGLSGGNSEAVRDSDLEDIVVPALAWMDDFEVDYHGFFRQLADYTTSPSSASTDAGVNTYNPDHVRQWVQRLLDPVVWQVRGDDAVAKVDTWLTKYHERIVTSDNPALRQDAERRRLMNKTNPAFVLRNWVAQKVIERVTAVVEKDRQERGKGGGGSASTSLEDAAKIEADRDLLDRVLDMCQNPFGDEVEEKEKKDSDTVVEDETCKVVKNNAGLEKYGEFVGPVPEWGQGIQCSCSS
ncbi:hypothetical protein DFQ27_003963 [Actinomortierella ambigua]|uniref:Selenoprotein O n=1 Tax=Actinomortierella ambigua TaxID=1343610 RepID=A0A9P6U523_9FUNG|nr:hypothetical protein DFQ27_003963 [Actinomortierella ambigua]